jgi:dipeptidyl aminopeptidase/acylaminoacyl peptidase
LYVTEYSNAPNGNRILKIKVDLKSGELRNDPEVLVSGLPNILGLSISADGGKLLCRQFTPISNLDMVLLGPGKDPRVYRRKSLTTGTGLVIYPAISPDGRQISYSAEVDGSMQVFIVDIERGVSNQVTHSHIDEYISRWSPDGARIAVLGSDMSLTSLILSVVNRDGTASRRLLSLPVSEMTKLLWLDWGAGNKIITFPSESGHMCVEVNTGDTVSWQLEQLSGKIAGPRLSPDGRLLALCTGDEIWLYSYADSTARLLTKESVSIQNWSRDSKWLYCYAGEGVILRVSVVSGTSDTLAVLPPTDWFAATEINNFAVSPDGDFVVYANAQIFRDIYVIEHFDPEVK